MSTLETPADLNALRDRVRAEQHARSLPLLVVGALLVNYGATSFSPHPMQWRYAAPLAFILIWVLGKLNEVHAGVGPGRADYLAAAGVVFTATNMLLLVNWLDRGPHIHTLFGLWVAIVGIVLAVLGQTSRDAVLLAAGVAVTLAGGLLATVGQIGMFSDGGMPLGHNWSMWLVAITGTVLAGIGLMLYRSERLQG